MHFFLPHLPLTYLSFPFFNFFSDSLLSFSLFHFLSFSISTELQRLLGTAKGKERQGLILDAIESLSHNCNNNSYSPNNGNYSPNNNGNYSPKNGNYSDNNSPNGNISVRLFFNSFYLSF